MILDRSPTTPWRDFMHRIVLGLALAMAANVVLFTAYAIGPVVDRVQETGVYRDTARLTALTDQRPLSMDVDGASAVITGTFVKRRCAFLRGNYYTRDARGLLYPAAQFESLVADADRNRVRPPSSEAQTFGPWRITSSIPDPTALVIYITMRCPEGDFAQLLADVPWRDMPATTP